MTSALTELANDYASILDAGVLSGIAESVVTFMPRIELVNSDVLQVYVVPATRTRRALSLGTPSTIAAETGYTIQVVLYRHHAEGDANEVDSADCVAELAESIQDATVGLNIGDYWVAGCEFTSGDGRLLDLDELEQRNAYCAVLEVAWREIG